MHVPAWAENDRKGWSLCVFLNFKKLQMTVGFVAGQEEKKNSFYGVAIPAERRVQWNNTHTLT